MVLSVLLREEIPEIPKQQGKYHWVIETEKEHGVRTQAPARGVCLAAGIYAEKV